MDQYKYDFYISYAESDFAWVNGFLIPLLDQEGKTHHSKCKFQLGIPEIKEMQDAAENSRKILLILSPEYLADPENEFFEFMAQEVSNSQNLYPIIPILRQKVELPLRLKVLVGLDFSDTEARDGSIRRLLEQTKLPHFDDGFGEPPYPGLSKFYQEQKECFYGRDQAIRNYTQVLYDEGCLFIVGASGSGKSSLVYAGILPRLSSSQYSSGESGWLIKVLEHPEQKPLSKLSYILGEDISDDAESIVKRLLKNSKKSQLLIFIDQLEEIFQGVDKENGIFYSALLKLSKISCVYLVFTFRADFYHFLTDSPISDLVSDYQENIKALTRDELKEAIEKPAISRGVYFDSILIERLLSDAGDQKGILPFIQITLRRLWSDPDRKLRWIPLDSYEKIGHQDGRVNGLKAAISRHADKVYNNLPSSQHKIIAKRIFIRLVNFSRKGNDRPIASRRAKISELKGYEDKQLFNETLNCLIHDGRLLRIDNEEESGGADSILDIGHDSLIENWPLLNEWIDLLEDHENARILYLGQLEIWNFNNRKYGFLDKHQIIDVEGLMLKDKSFYNGINEDLSSFVINSKKHIHKLKKRYFLIGVFVFLFLPMLFYIFSAASNEYYYSKAKSYSDNHKVEFLEGNYPVGMQQDVPEDKNGPKTYFQLPGFYMDKYEVTNRNYCLCVKVGFCGSPDYPDVKGKKVCDIEVIDQPVSNVNIYEAQKYCRWVKGRLPHEVEWEHSARGFSDRRYPYVGSFLSAEDVNAVNSEQGHKKTIFEIRKDITPRGIVGLTGNIREWTLSEFSSYSDIKLLSDSGADTAIGDLSSVRGMSYLDNYEFFHLSHRGFLESKFRGSYVGFRCVYDK